MTDMALHGLLADEEPRGDVGIGHPVGQQLEDLALALRQHLLALAGQQSRHQRGVDVALAAGDLLDRAEERRVWRLLEDVALRARLEPAAQQAALTVGREDEDGGRREALVEDLRRFEPVHAGHAHIHDHDVGSPALGDRHCARSVRRFPDDADLGSAGQREAKPLADDLVVVSDEARDLGRCSVGRQSGFPQGTMIIG
jgi:hypothetical protein